MVVAGKRVMRSIDPCPNFGRTKLCGGLKAQTRFCGA